MADFLRISPWQAHDIRDALHDYQVDRLLVDLRLYLREKIVRRLNRK
ncbi:hypothetical protein MNBD_CHLOROFLEXI01-1536 [hydrothermal vent metagenome]|uniref:Uncharacterized protein n=1 Tax=hydrothermal vent metagenome TaxID=652676 RepID=A0A3B0VLG2_9ZZZZ